MVILDICLKSHICQHWIFLHKFTKNYIFALIIYISDIAVIPLMIFYVSVLLCSVERNFDSESSSTSAKVGNDNKHF